MAKKVLVIGGGLAGLTTTMKLAEAGCIVTLISVTKVKRSHSVCAQGGINAALNAKNEGDHPLIHAYETLKGGDFLAEQAPVIEMCLAAPQIIQLMDRLGCPFNRTTDGSLDVRRFGGTLYNRTVFCGASTGQQLLYTLDEQVRRYEAKGLVHKFENHEFVRLIQNEDGHACGAIVLDLFNLSHTAHLADAVVIATGGCGVLFRKSTNSTFCTGAALARLYKQGMQYANGEFIQIHPTAIPGEDKLRLMSESARGEGGRIWVYGDSSKKIQSMDGRELVCGQTGKPWYFLEDLYPAYGNLVPRDIAAREILRICELGLGIDGKMQVFLDVTHVPKERQKKLEAILDIYGKFTGEDPKAVPMKIFPAVHYSMGGAWVDWPAHEDSNRHSRFRQMTNIAGCFCVGEADYAYHGANRLGANSLLSCIFGGLICAQEVVRYSDSTKKTLKQSEIQNALDIEENHKSTLFGRTGNENAFCLHDELSDVLIKHVTVKRNNRDLQQALCEICAIREKFSHAALPDHSRFGNQSFIFYNQFEAMLELALIITQSALERNESRGSHFKEEYQARDDKEWLKTTIATYNEATKMPKISYRPLEKLYVTPIMRDYSTAEKVQPHFENLPKKIPLPLGGMYVTE